jgi:hypothetical protein
MKKKETDHNPLGLEPYTGEAVTELGVRIPSAGNPLREPLALDPTLMDGLKHLRAGDTIYLVLQCVKERVAYTRAKDHDGWKRVDILKVEGAAVVDADVALPAIDAQRQRIEDIKDEMEGRMRLPLPEDEVDASLHVLDNNAEAR